MPSLKNLPGKCFKFERSGREIGGWRVGADAPCYLGRGSGRAQARAQPRARFNPDPGCFGDQASFRRARKPIPATKPRVLEHGFKSLG